MATLKGIVTTPWRWLRAFARSAFGELSWQPPRWGVAGAGIARARPAASLAAVLAIVAVAYGAWWYAHRPKVIDPDALRFDVTAPELTRYRETPPVVSNLTVSFSGSAAPIELIEKTARGVTIEPAIDGVWTWHSDTHLAFDPAGDWPVGEHYTVTFDTKTAFAPGVRLDEKSFVFDTAAFAATVASAEFYQDPQDPARKLGSYAVEFTHPVDVAAFERKLTFALVDGAKTKLQAPDVTVTYDEPHLKAFVQSKPLAVPENGGTLTLTVDDGVASVLGGRGTKERLTRDVALPSLYSVKVNGVSLSLVDNERFEPEQVLIVDVNDSIRDRDVADQMKAWLLPVTDLSGKHGSPSSPYGWSVSGVSDAVLAKSEPLKLTPLPAEREYVTTHSFRYVAPPGRRLYVRIPKGLRSFGGFLMGAPYATVNTVPAYPELLRFVGDGALLSLKGERRVTIAARNSPGMRIEVARVMPDQLQHLAQYNSGTLDKPRLYSIAQDSLTERFVKQIPFKRDDPAKTEYEGIDLGEYFTADRHGVFLLRLFRDDPATPNDDGTEGYEGSPIDSRLVVLTDLGMIAKRALDGTRHVFVMSLSAGTPVAGASVAVVARNGERLIVETTDVDGAVKIPDLEGFKREKAPVMLAVSREGDLSFLPLTDGSRNLELSRFDIGGEVNSVDPGKLDAYLFSDRGLYRPGDTIHIGLILRAQSWAQELSGIPLEYRLTDPRGTLVQRERITFGAAGFEERAFTPADTAPSGTYEAALYLVDEHGNATTQLGTTTVQVREFVPDRMRVRVAMSKQSVEGWVAPEELAANVTVENLFGTPAQDRRVAGALVLQPAFPKFARWPDHQFYDPMRAKDGYSEELTDTTTDATGHATFALDLSQYDRATYQLRFSAQAFEAGGGRGVLAETGVLVSSNAYLVGLKSLEALSYVQRGAARTVNIVAIGPDAKSVAVDGLHAVLIERRWVSVLTKQDSGLYKYVSQLRREERSRSALTLAAGGHDFKLATDQPGDFTLEVRDSKDVVLNQIDYSVAGAANVTRSLDRSAELQVKLSKADFAPGEEVELSVVAPYVGGGLITIERDGVYAVKWFRSDTTSSVQRIRVPEGLEGNAYVNVQFVRDPSSAEIFMSPLSYAVVPFSIDRGARRQAMTLAPSKLVKPGETARFKLTVEGGARVVVFAVDEGILQVARYELGDPLDHFFKKKMLQVDTAQILDLILPEFSRLAGLSAPGGDAENALAKNLNPFKRRGDKPAVYWSGLVDIDGEHTFEYTVPDSFNGKLRVMAVAVSPQRIGIAQGETLVRGDFVLSPNAPMQVAPGDEFEVSVGVANAVESTDTAAMPIAVTLATPNALTIVGEATQTVAIAPGNEGVAKFRVRAGDALGAHTLSFGATAAKYSATRKIDLSLRPGIAYRTDLRVGSTDKPVEEGALREMHAELSKRNVAASVSPLVVIDGLAAYLADYPHYCSEQLLSQALPALVYRAHPELGRVDNGLSGDRTAGIIAMLRQRQNGAGGVGAWEAMPDASPFVSAYAALYLIEARERDITVPDDVIDRLNNYLNEVAADRSLSDLEGFRSRALAVYLLTRQGRTTTNLLTSLHEQLDRDLPKGYTNDATAMFLAASYQLLKQEKPASALAKAPIERVNDTVDDKNWLRYAGYYDDAIASAWTVYLVSKHFGPAQRAKIATPAIARLLYPVKRNLNNTLSSALIVLALDAWSSGSTTQAPPELFALVGEKQRTALGTIDGIVRRGPFSAGTRAIAITPLKASIGWYAITQSGFDRKAPPAVQDRGLELLRDYLDATGQPTTTLAVGDEVDVRIRVRALGADVRGDIAIVDLLPGGFEVVMQQEPASADSGEHSDSDDASGDESGEGEYDGEESDAESDSTERAAAPTVARAGSTLAVEHEEVREDRVVLYATATAGVTEYRYRIKATAIGAFVIPPPYAESMYERDVYAQGVPSGTLTVTAPKQP
jgi:uncharacterized protein YfaS (alpha-2-macroglobulin family)